MDHGSDFCGNASSAGVAASIPAPGVLFGVDVIGMILPSPRLLALDHPDQPQLHTSRSSPAQHLKGVFD